MEELQELSSDQQLKEQNDTFWIKRILKWVLAGVLYASILVVFFFFVRELIVNEVFRMAILDTVWREMSTIIIAVFAILGIRYSK